MTRDTNDAAAGADEVSVRLQSALGDALVAVYLHGSAVLGGYVPGKSDLDILAVSAGPLSQRHKEAAARALTEPARWSSPMVEFSLVTRDTAAVPTEGPPFELHVVTGSEPKVVDGADHPGDADLVLHFAVCRAHGRSLFGPPPEELFAPIPREWVLRALARELDWALRHGSVEYQVLNGARAWRYQDAGVLGSKVAGGEWARERLGGSELIDGSLARQLGTDEGAIEPAEAAVFVRRILALLARGALGGAASQVPKDQGSQVPTASDRLFGD